MLLDTTQAWMQNRSISLGRIKPICHVANCMINKTWTCHASQLEVAGTLGMWLICVTETKTRRRGSATASILTLAQVEYIEVSHPTPYFLLLACVYIVTTKTVAVLQVLYYSQHYNIANFKLIQHHLKFAKILTCQAISSTFAAPNLPKKRKNMHRDDSLSDMMAGEPGNTDFSGVKPLKGSSWKMLEVQIWSRIGWVQRKVSWKGSMLRRLLACNEWPLAQHEVVKRFWSNS